MLRFLGCIVVAIAFCAGNSARAEDEFSAARHYPGLAAKWRDVQARMSEEALHVAACRADPGACRDEERRIAAILEASREWQGRARIGHINRAVNLAIRPISDLQRFGVSDRWSAPVETLQAGGGDCEDYAILKFMILREAGFSDSELKLLIVRQAGIPTDHAVLAVRTDGEWLILDNRGFTLVRLDDSRYRVLMQLAAETSPAMPASQELASASASDLPPLL